MISCKYPGCIYQVPDSQTPKLYQHIKSTHNTDKNRGKYPQESGARNISEGNMKKVTKDKICSMMRSSVLSLCKENYSCAIEVDALICISVLNSPEQHVVKIHDLLTESGQFVNAMSISSLPTTNTEESSQSSKDETPPQPVLFVHNSASTNQTPTSAAKKPVSGDKSKNTDENISRFPFLVQTLKESQRNQNRAASASPTMPSNVQQSRPFYSNLPTSNTPLVDTDRPASSLLKMLSSQKQQLQPQPNMKPKQINEPEQGRTSLPPKPNDNGQVQVQKPDYSSNLIMNVKEEPVDDGLMDVQQGTSIDKENTSTTNLTSESVKEQSENFPVKNEPAWNADDYGGNVASDQHITDGKSNDGSSADQNDLSLKLNQGNDTSESADKRKSILADILEGKERTYTSEREAKGSPVPSSSFKETCDEPDSSLLYRLPYTDFKDLFPSSSSIPEKRKSGNQNKTTGKRCKSDLDKIMRKMLEEKKSADTKRQPPRKKKKTVYYEEYDSMSSDCEVADSPDLPSEKEEDENYVPTGYERSELGVSKGTDPDFSMSLRRKKSKKTPKRAVAVKSTTKQTPSRKLRYACYHCQLRFRTSDDRDKHEESNCTGQHGLIECDVCKGYFANSSSKNKHMFEIHSILPEEQKEEIQATRKEAADEFKTIEQNPFEFETLRSSCGNNEDRLQFDVEASTFDNESAMELVTKFIVPYSIQNNKKFIKCPLCLNMFSDSATKDQHLRIKHRIANQIDNGDGTISLQVRELTPSNIPPVYVKYEQANNN